MSSPNLETWAAIDEDCKRMRWASRRGMLELDLILLPFAENFYPGLSADDKKCYELLLSCEDQDLLAWLLRGEVPVDKTLRRIVDMVRTSDD